MSEGDSHLSRIETHWSVVARAHAGDPAAARDSRHLLLARYGPAAHRYLFKLARDPDAASELYQEFALKVLGGSFKGADASRGRFRDYVKTTLFRLVSDHRRRQRFFAGKRADVEAEDLPAAPDPALEETWRESRREELIKRATRLLEELEQGGGPKMLTVLRWKISHPELDSSELARRIEEMTGEAISPVNVRQLVHRGRERLAKLIVYELEMMLGTADPEILAEELAELGLLEQCRGALPSR